jgi:hypothetical protein
MRGTLQSLQLGHKKVIIAQQRNGFSLHKSLTTLTIRLEVELAAFLKEDKGHIIPLDLSSAL